MNKILLILIVFTASLMAKSTMASPLPKVHNQFIDLDESECNEGCLKEYLDRGFIFSFMAKYKKDSQSEELKAAYSELQLLFNTKSGVITQPFDVDTSANRIAFLIPKKIFGKYAMSTTTAVMSYLLLRGVDFEFEVFNTVDESDVNIIKKLDEIRAKGYSFVISPVTKKGARVIFENAGNLIVYIPTINKNFLGSEYSNIYYGGVDYSKQIQTLLPYAKSQISIFKTAGEISQMLTDKVKFNFDNVVFEKKIEKNLRVVRDGIRAGRRFIRGQSVFLNTPIVKSSMILSQFRANGVKPYSILSTQINYDPGLLSLTQYRDRKNFLIANSIGESPFELVETNKMLNNNIRYNWINYATSVGIDYIYSNYFKQDKIFNEEMIDNQIKYNVRIMQALDAKFRIIPSMIVD